jgi:hypothetical protein
MAERRRIEFLLLLALGVISIQPLAAQPIWQPMPVGMRGQPNQRNGTPQWQALPTAAIQAKPLVWQVVPAAAIDPATPTTPVNANPSPNSRSSATTEFKPICWWQRSLRSLAS